MDGLKLVNTKFTMKISPDFSSENQGSLWVFDSIFVLEMTNVSVGFGWSPCCNILFSHVNIGFVCVLHTSATSQTSFIVMKI